MKYLRHFNTIQEADHFLNEFDRSYSILATVANSSVPLLLEKISADDLNIYVETTQRYCSGSVFTPDSTLRDILIYLRDNMYFAGDGGAAYVVWYNGVELTDWRGTNENWDKSLSELGISSGVLYYRGVWL